MDEKNYAVIKNGLVIQTEMLDTPTAEYLEELRSKYNADEVILGDVPNAGVGASWDGAVFLLPKPYPSWVLNEFFQWIAPVPYPFVEEEAGSEAGDTKWWLEDTNKYDSTITPTEYVWNETVINWVPKA